MNTPNLSEDQEREAFERWMSEDGKWPAAVTRSGEGYMLAHAQSSWIAFQAGRAAAEALRAVGAEPVAFVAPEELERMRTLRRGIETWLFPAPPMGDLMPLYAAPPRAVPQWKPIETAPKHQEVLCWREDQGVFIAQCTTPDAVMAEDEYVEADFPEGFCEWVHDSWGWMQGEERPTHWMPLPAAPSPKEQGESE